jgi:hypothetical protein
MADSDKNIRITTNKNKATLPPNIVFTGASAGTSVLTLEVRDDNSIAFTGIDGDVFSLDYNLSTGTIWSVNDKSGTPLLRASAGGTIGIAELGTGVFVGIGQTNPKYKLDVQGWAGFASTGDGSYTILIENGLATGNNALSIRAANALRFYNSGNTLYTGFIGVQAGVNTTYTLPPRTPTGTGTSYLSSGIDGVMAWVAAPTSGGSGSVNSGTATYAAYYATTTNAVSENANLQFTGTGVSIGGRINSTSTTSGSVYIYGGIGVTGNAFIGGTAYIPSTTPSNISNLLVSNNTATVSTTSGALVVSGGLGLAGNAFIGSTVYVPSTTPSNFSNLLISNNTSSTSVSSGALVVNGGLGIAGNAFIGGTFVHQSTASSVGTNSGSVTLAGGVGIAGNAFIGGTFVNQNSTSSVGTNSGSVTLAGGVGIAGNAFIGGTFVSQNSTSSVGTNSGAITVAGGVGIAGNAFIGGTTTITNTTASIGTDSGALVIRGGVGIGQSVSVGGSLNIFNGSNYSGFRFAGSANTTYTLPPRTPTGTGTSYLSSGIDGVMAWVAAPTSGGSATPGGTNTGDIQYKSGSSFAAVTDFNFDATYNSLTVSNFPFTTPITATTAGLKLLGGTTFTGASSNGTMLAINGSGSWAGNLIEAQKNGAQRLILDSSGYLTLGASGTGFTLPILNGTSGQVLTANTNGVASWTTVTGSSGAGSGTVAIPGAQYQVAAYYWSATGASVSGSTTFTNNTATGVVEISHTTESTSTLTGALVVDGGAGIAKSLYVGTTLQVGQNPNYTIPNVLATFTSTVNSYNQVVIGNKSNGTAASADFVLNNDVSTDTATYGNFGINSSTFTGSGAFFAPSAVYVSATTAPLVLGTTTAHPIRFAVNNGATDILYIDGAGAAISVFANLGLRSASDLRFWNSGNTQYAGIQGGNTSNSYLITMPTATVGAGSSVLVTGSDGQMYFAAPGSGIAFSSATANTPLIRAKRSLNLQFSSGYTPVAAGADTAIIRVPESASDGTSVLTYNLRRFQVRVETPSAGSSRLQLERSSTDTGAFTLAAAGSSHIGGFGVTITGAGIYLTSVTSFAGSFVTSGNLLRLNWTLLNATHANFSVNLILEEV